MIIDDITYHQNLFFELKKFRELPCPIFLKLEGLNFAGSIKLKPAVYILNKLEQEGKLKKNFHHIIESSSGNLAIALAMVCHSKGYPFTAVIDMNTSKDVIKLLSVYKANFIVVKDKDANGGFLETRINTIKQMLKKDSRYVWINQYANSFNSKSHYETTAREIHDLFRPGGKHPLPTHIFVGSSTTGTLNGIVDYFSEHSPSTKIIAVEPEGSITFSDKVKSRFIPGIGASRRPELAQELNRDGLHDVIWVKEVDTIVMCHRLVDEYSLLLGGSTGSVVSAILAYQHHLKKDDIVIGISPDLGQKYLDTVYNEEWIPNSVMMNDFEKDITNDTLVGSSL